MAGVVYSLCALTALLCTFLLFRGFFKTKARLLLWSALCFSGLTINNIILVFDRLIFTGADLSSLRLIAALIAMIPLLYGFIWDDE